MSNSRENVLLRLNAISYNVENHSSSRNSRLNWLYKNKPTVRHERSTLINRMSVDSLQENDSTKKWLLKNINLTILANEKISIIGPNGAGKSTLMKIILGLLKPTSGDIFCHSPLTISYVPQKFSVPPILPLRVLDLLTQVDQNLTVAQKDMLFERLSIAPLLPQQLIHLSGGETQRVLLARALLSKPDLLILDEPMQGLDPESERWLYEFIDDLPTFLQCAMVVVSHDLHWVMQGSRRVICLNKHICCEGQPSDLGMTDEFKAIFGHQFEQPYIHNPHSCTYTSPVDL